MEHGLTGPLVRTMRLPDLSAVTEIDRESFPHPWSQTLWRDELCSALGLYLVLEEKGTVFGYIGVKVVTDELHIMTIAVHPARRRRGFARALIEAALDDPASAEARGVYLEVRPSNSAARALYASLGFVEAGIRSGYYGDEDALLMTLYLQEGQPS